MKKFTGILLLITAMLAHRAQAQGLPSKIDFSSYAPTNRSQFKGTCYAYATTYTALSVKYNLIQKTTSFKQVNQNAFSAAFTASMLRKHKCILKKMFSFWSCSSGGNIEKAAGIIQKYGAIFNGEMDGCCFVPTSDQATKAVPYQIKGYKLIPAKGEDRNEDAIKTTIKTYLSKQVPVVCAIHQTTLLRNNQNLDFLVPGGNDPGTAGDAYTDSNHAICILGYDDNRKGGSFLVKNNYSSFGLNGFTWITYTDFMKYFTYALVLGDFTYPDFKEPVGPPKS